MTGEIRYLALQEIGGEEAEKIVYFGPLEERAMGFNQKRYKVYKVEGKEITRISHEGKISEREQRMLEGMLYPKRSASKKPKSLLS